MLRVPFADKAARPGFGVLESRWPMMAGLGLCVRVAAKGHEVPSQPPYSHARAASALTELEGNQREILVNRLYKVNWI